MQFNLVNSKEQALYLQALLFSVTLWFRVALCFRVAVHLSVVIYHCVVSPRVFSLIIPLSAVCAFSGLHLLRSGLWFQPAGVGLLANPRVVLGT